MVLMGWILLAMFVLFVLQAVFETMDLTDTSNAVNFAGFGCALVGAIGAYLSFYTR